MLPVSRRGASRSRDIRSNAFTTPHPHGRSLTARDYKRNPRYTTLLALIEGPAKLSIDSEAPQYVLSAARWTSVDRFESEAVPRYLERARFLRTHILLEADKQRPTARRQYLQQLGDRLAFSSRLEVRKEALLDRTRAWFWLTRPGSDCSTGSKPAVMDACAPDQARSGAVGRPSCRRRRGGKSMRLHIPNR